MPYVPTGQEVHKPPAKDVVPTGWQDQHEADLTFEVLPASQFVHRPPDRENLPAGQSKHGYPAEEVPSGQL